MAKHQVHGDVSREIAWIGLDALASWAEPGQPVSTLLPEAMILAYNAMASALSRQREGRRPASPCVEHSDA